MSSHHSNDGRESVTGEFCNVAFTTIESVDRMATELCRLFLAFINDPAVIDPEEKKNRVAEALTWLGALYSFVYSAGLSQPIIAAAHGKLTADEGVRATAIHVESLRSVRSELAMPIRTFLQEIVKVPAEYLDPAFRYDSSW